MEFALNASANANTGKGAGAAAFDLQGGSFAVNGSFLAFGGLGYFKGTMEGGTLLVSRPNNPGFFIGEDATSGGSASFTQTGGAVVINAATIVGGRNGGTGTISVSGASTGANPTTAGFLSGPDPRSAGLRPRHFQPERWHRKHWHGIQHL